MFLTIGLLLCILVVVDTASTYALLSQENVLDWNPLIQGFIDAYGLGVGLLVALALKLIFVLCFLGTTWVGYTEYDSGLLHTMIMYVIFIVLGVYMYVVTVNLFYLSSVF